MRRKEILLTAKSALHRSTAITEDNSGEFPGHLFFAAGLGDTAPMSRIVLAAIAFAVLGYLGYHAMYGAKTVTLEDQVAHAPKRQLDNVRVKAKAMEAQDQKAVDDIAAKTAE